MSKEIIYQVGAKEQRITASGTEVLAEGIRQLQDRVDSEHRDSSSVSIKLDKSNKVSFPDYPYLFEALGEKILVSIDVYKSGYECKTCLGKKTVLTTCICEMGGHPGKKYSDEELRTIADTIGQTAAVGREHILCTECNGNYANFRHEEQCQICHGTGHTIIIPDTAKKLPTTGVVVSIGNKCRFLDLNFKVGDRIIFGPYAGSMIPTKAGLMFKILDASQAWCRIEGGEDLAAFDFVIQDKEAL